MTIWCSTCMLLCLPDRNIATMDVRCFPLSKCSDGGVISMNNDTLGWMFVHSSPKERQFNEGKVKGGLLLATSVWRVAVGDNSHMLRAKDWSGK